ncbi:M48 family metallopeptidase [Moorena producens JHB]|uniref:M48 family metallopeptidase n=1 Tax=Moorena producens (strain JHB) TaxID=1454205 RepID=A0A1D9G2G9_MOOP1|nr:M48 family metallopeptidase [Moorena producens]AOY81819.1 M48 family metallopeptidase [Moorena producens JHB]
MTNEEFDTLVKKLEDYAQQYPSNYKLRVGLLAALGYAYIFLVLAGLLGVLGLVVLLIYYSGRINRGMVQLIMILLVPAWMIMRSLWVSFPPPQGLKLQRQQVPKLFALIDELTKALKAPSFHHVILTSEFNAAVVQIPRLGLLGWQQNYLILGLPLLQALSPRQFRAVLAHELGHLSGNHSSFAAWIYRLRQTWEQIWQQLGKSQHAGATVLFHGFFNWYSPFFNAYSFVIARANEYEADRCAAELAGSQHVAEALLSVQVKAQYLEQSFWNDIYQKAYHQPNPPQTPLQDLAKALSSPIEPNQQQQWIRSALMSQTHHADTHPCLLERLKALKYPFKARPSLPILVKVTAAEQFLGKALLPLTQELERQWHTTINYQWRQNYTQAQAIRQSLEALEAKAAHSPLSVEEAWNRARWTLDLVGTQEAIPLLKSVLTRQADHVSANYLLGQILIAQDNEAGIDYLEQAMARDPDSVLSGTQSIYGFLRRQGRDAEADQYRQRAAKHHELLTLAQEERSGFSQGDRFQPHGLSAEVEAALQQQLAGYPEIKEAYLVRKVVLIFPDNPYYILGVSRQRHFLESNSSTKDQQLIDRLADELECPGQTWITILNSTNKSLKKALRKTAISPIYHSVVDQSLIAN